MTLDSSNALQVDHNPKELQRMHLNENLVFPKNVMRRIIAKGVDEFDPRVYPPSIYEGESLVLNRELARVLRLLRKICGDRRRGRSTDRPALPDDRA